MTRESRCVPGWEQGAPAVDLRKLSHEGVVPRGTLSREGAAPRRMMSSRGSVPGGTLSHRPEVCQGVSDVTAPPVGLGTGRQHRGNLPGCGKGCEGVTEQQGMCDGWDLRSLGVLDMIRVGSPQSGERSR